MLLGVKLGRSFCIAILMEDNQSKSMMDTKVESCGNGAYHKPYGTPHFPDSLGQNRRMIQKRCLVNGDG